MEKLLAFLNSLTAKLYIPCGVPADKQLRRIIMAWINPLDRLPQIPQDYANHIAYGGFGSIPVALFFNVYYALAFMFVISAAKKIVDYYKEMETLKMCVAKTFVSCAWPASFVLLNIFHGM